MALGLLGGGIAASPFVNDFFDRSSRIRDIRGNMLAQGRGDEAPSLLDMYNNDAFRSPVWRDNEDRQSPFNMANALFYGQTWDDNYTRGQAWDDMYQQDFANEANAAAMARAQVSAGPGYMAQNRANAQWAADPMNPANPNYNSAAIPGHPDYDPLQDPNFQRWRAQEDWRAANAPGEPVNPYGFYKTPANFATDQELYTNANGALSYIDSALDYVNDETLLTGVGNPLKPEIKSGLQTTSMLVLARNQGALSEGELAFWEPLATGNFDAANLSDNKAKGYLRTARSRMQEAQTQTFSRIMNSLPPQITRQMYNADGSINQQAMEAILQQYGLTLPYASRTSGSSIPDPKKLP